MAKIIDTKVVVLCTNSNGAPEFHTCSVSVTEKQISQGDHYELAKGNATYNGFEEPMIAFDAQDEAGKQLGEIHVWL
jgi:hypothetical protein